MVTVALPPVVRFTVPPAAKPVNVPPAASAIVNVATVLEAVGKATVTPPPIVTASKPEMFAPVVVVMAADVFNVSVPSPPAIV